MSYNAKVAAGVVALSCTLALLVKEGLVLKLLTVYFLSFASLGVMSLISSGSLVFHDEDGFVFSNKRASKYFWKENKSSLLLVAMLPALIILVARFILLEATR